MAYIYRNYSNYENSNECSIQLCEPSEDDEKVNNCECIFNDTKDSISKPILDDVYSSSKYMIKLDRENTLHCPMVDTPEPAVFKCVESNESDPLKSREIIKIYPFQTVFNVDHDDEYEDIDDDSPVLFTRDTCFWKKKKESKNLVCKYSICSQNKKGHKRCKDTTKYGKLMRLRKSTGVNNKQYLFIPKYCRNFHDKKKSDKCSPYVCDLEKDNELVACKKVDYCYMRNITFHEGCTNNLISQDNSMQQSSEGNISQLQLLGATFLPFLFFLFFIVCYLNMKLGWFGEAKKKRIRRRERRRREEDEEKKQV